MGRILWCWAKSHLWKMSLLQRWQWKRRRESKQIWSRSMRWKVSRRQETSLWRYCWSSSTSTSLQGHYFGGGNVSGSFRHFVFAASSVQFSHVSHQLTSQEGRGTWLVCKLFSCLMSRCRLMQETSPNWKWMPLSMPATTQSWVMRHALWVMKFSPHKCW